MTRMKVNLSVKVGRQCFAPPTDLGPQNKLPRWQEGLKSRPHVVNGSACCTTYYSLVGVIGL